MYLAAAHDPNDTRHATLRPPSHHDMHAQYVNPGALVPRTARFLVPSTSWQPPNPIFYADRTPLHALRISYTQAHVISPRLSCASRERLTVHVVFLLLLACALGV
jgi:hypothetical protein